MFGNFLEHKSELLFVVIPEYSSKMSEYTGYLDSGCNQTIIPDISWFESFEDCSIYVGVATSKTRMRCTAIGWLFNVAGTNL